MRVLFVTHNFPRYQGDRSGAFLALLAQALTPLGCEVSVVAPHAPGVPERERFGEVEVRRFRYAPDALEVVAYRGDLHRSVAVPKVAAALPGFLIAFRAAVRRAVAETRPDLVHAHWWFPGGWASAGVKAPLVLTCHGTDVRLLERPWVRPFARTVFRRAAATTAVSDFLANDIQRLLGDTVRRPEVVRMPIDVEKFAAGRTVTKAMPPRVLYAGNLVASKGVDLLIRAFAIVLHGGTSARLRIVGDGSEKARLQQLAAELGIEGSVEWSGFLPHQEMPAEYGASTVAVLPSVGRAEGLGLVLVEALLAGAAVVGTPTGGIPEVVSDGTTGLLARDQTPAALAEQLERLLTDGTLRERTVTAGSAFARASFASGSVAHRFHDLYRVVLSAHSSR